MADDLPEMSAARLKRLQVINEAVLAALREEAELALKLRIASGWEEISREFNDAADALRKRMRRGDSFDIALAWFVGRELEQLAAEVRHNLNLWKVPQWPN